MQSKQKVESDSQDKLKKPNDSKQEADFEKETKQILDNNGLLVLYRWRQYEIEVTAENRETGEKAIASFEFNTLLWKCGKDSEKQITVTELCDKKEDCPNGEDEKPETCRVTQLPKKLSYLFYVYMVLIILLYFTNMRTKTVLSQGQHLEMITKKSFEKYLNQGSKSGFLILYHETHLKPGFEEFCKSLKYEIYQNPDDLKLCKWIQEAEQELHKDARDAYNCILVNFGGSHPVTAKIADPESLMSKIVIMIDQIFQPRKIKWHFLRIILMFVILLIHLFDYVKDIGKISSNKFPYIN